jgi:small-conductance mechanosensitive channel
MFTLREFSPVLTYSIAFALFLIALCGCVAVVDRVGLKSMARNLASGIMFLLCVSGAIVYVTGDPSVYKALGPSARQWWDTARDLVAWFFS